MSALKQFKKVEFLQSRKRFEETILLYKTIIREHPETIYSEQAMTALEDIAASASHKTIYKVNLRSYKSLACIALTTLVGVYITYYLLVFTLVFLPGLIVISSIFYIHYLPVFFILF